MKRAGTGGTRPREALVGGRRVVAEAIRAGRARRVMAARGARASQGLRELMEASRRAGIPVEWVEPSAVDDLRVSDHQGVVAWVSMPEEIGERDAVSMPYPPDAVVVVLDGISDPQNLGACARSAEAAGAALLVVRKRRAAPMTPAAVRASAGALLHLPVARVPNLSRLLDRMKDVGFTVVGLEHAAPASIHEPAPDGRLALVVGSEEEGMSRLVRETCDLLVSIPLAGVTASLNASAALAVALFAYARRSR